jgi:hypothetical protein
VIGTLVLARAALEAKLTRFTMISTDKAVRPESVMGASKRMAELVIQAFGESPACETRSASFVRQRARLIGIGSAAVSRPDPPGRTSHVTHEDITRFFMSIPEATQLVLQASALAQHGEVFVLDMRAHQDRGFSTKYDYALGPQRSGHDNPTETSRSPMSASARGKAL